MEAIENAGSADRVYGYMVPISFVMTDEDRKAAKLKELFTIKLEAFEIEEVKNSDNKDLRSRIRKSTSAVEISACVAMIMMEAKSAPAKSAPAKATTKKAKTTKGK